MNQPPDLHTIGTPPIAPKHPQLLVSHNDKRVDNYFWMRERENPQVIAYLEVENTYTSAVMQHTEGLQIKLYEEMLGRIKETDLSVPYRLDDYYYYSRTESGLAYPIYCRKKSSLEAAEQVLLDQNQLAQGHEFFRIGVFKVSPNHQILAYSVDTTGAEQYTLFFLDLNTFESSPIRKAAVSDTRAKLVHCLSAVCSSAITTNFSDSVDRAVLLHNLHSALPVVQFLRYLFAQISDGAIALFRWSRCQK